MLLDHFRVERRIGRGAMGEVYLARDLELGRKVALKVYREDVLKDDADIERFLTEARLTARLNHPNIVTIFYIGRYQDRPYLALEYLEGQTLQERMANAPAGRAETIRIGLAIAEALVEAHGRGVLHRDLKPANVLLPRDGRLRVVDFGIAKRISIADYTFDEPTLPGRTRQEIAQQVLGTPLYMAPEQWQGQDNTGATDIWALGVILFELLTGRAVYDASELARLAVEVCQPEPAPRADAVAAVPKPLADLVAACLEKDPARRPRAEEVCARLKGALIQAPNLPVDDSPFRGLLPFSEGQAHLFFGRDTEVSALLERIPEEPVFPVLGASGVGKSSFVSAGVIPRLQDRDTWLALSMRAGSFPFRTLALKILSSTKGGTRVGRTPSPGPLRDYLAGIDAPELAERLRDAPALLGLLLRLLAEEAGAKVLLFVDQLEELLTMVQDAEDRRRFLEALLAAADDPADPVRLIFTMRSDFVGDLEVTTGREAVLRGVTLLQRPSAEGLRAFLEGSLDAVGYRWEDEELVDDMIASVGGEENCLPLLQFSARQLWDARDRENKVIPRSAYEAIGGVAGALAEHADELIARFSRSEVELAREVLLRLVTPNRTRRALSRAALLDGLDPGSDKIVERFVDARLIALRTPADGIDSDVVVELAHESLIDAWDRLSRWIDESHENLALLGEIEEAAALWENRGGRTEEVWRGSALRDACRVVERATRRLPPRVTRFIEAGKAAERRSRRKRGVAVGTSIGFGVAVLVTAVAGSIVLAAKEREASAQRERAEAQRAEAQREGARAALARGSLLEARAKVRGSMETHDSLLARALWADLERPLVWSVTHQAFISAVGFSPEGDLLASAGVDRSIHLHDVETKEIRSLRGHEDQVYDLAFSLDGQRLASASRGGRVLVWDLSTGTIERVLAGHAVEVWSVSFSGDGRKLASGGADGMVRVWSVESGAKIAEKNAGGPVLSVAFDGTGERLVSGDALNTVTVWELVGDGKPIRLEGHGDAVYGVDFLPDGQSVLSSSWDGTIRHWSVEPREAIRVFRGHQGKVYRLAVGPDGHHFASVGEDGTLRVWDLESGEEERVLHGHEREAVAVAISPDGRLVATGSHDRVLRLWDVTVAPDDAPMEGHDSELYCLAFSPDGRTLGSVDELGEVRLWDVASGSQIREFSDDTKGGFGIQFSPDGQIIAYSGSDGVRLVDRSSWDSTLLPLGGARAWGLAFSSDGGLIAAGGDDSTVRVWTTDESHAPEVFRGHAGSVINVDFSPSEELLASAGADGTVRIWDVGEGGQTKTLLGHDGPVYGLRFSRDGRRLASAGGDGRVIVWDRQTWDVILLHESPERYYWAAFADDTTLAVPGSDRLVHLWDVETQRHRTVAGHDAEVNCVEFSPDGGLFASAGDDATVRLWETESARRHWWGSALLPNPMRALTHRGWQELEEPVAGSGVPGGEPSWQRALEKEGRLAATSGDQLCVARHDRRIQLWDMGASTLVAEWPQMRVGRLWAGASGCVVLSEGQVYRLHPDEPVEAVALDQEASAVALQGEAMLIATDAGVYRLEGSTLSRVARDTGAGVTALLPGVGDRYLVGYQDGAIVARTSSDKLYSFEMLTASPASHMLEGPQGTLIAGFVDGTVGVWDQRTGMLLEEFRLHGPLADLARDADRLYAVTELGRTHAADLSYLTREYCDLMKEIWEAVPVLWEEGRPVVKLSQSHRCLTRR